MAKPVEYTFWGYWRSLAVKIPGLLFHSWRIWLAIPGFMLFFVALANRIIAETWLEKWKGFSPWWSLVVLSILVLWGLMEAIYERDREVYLSYKTIEDQYKPGIRAEIDEVILSSELVNSPYDKNTTFISLIVSIRNIGDATGLEGWELEVNLPDGNKLNGILFGIPPVQTKYRLGDKDQLGDFVLKGTNALYELALKTIAKGAILRGLLVFMVHNIQKEDCLHTTIVLSFKDVYEHLYSITKNLSIIKPIDKFLHSPGLDIVK